MNYLDVIIIVPVVWGIYKGFKNGLIVEVASLVALILGVWVASRFSWLAAKIMLNDIGLNISQEYISPISFAVTFIIVAIAIVLVSRMIDKFLSAIALGGINKLVGAVFGGAKVLLIIAVALFFLNGIDNRIHIIKEEKKDESKFYRPMIDIIYKVLPNIDVEEIKKSIPDEFKKKDKEKNEKMEVQS